MKKIITLCLLFLIVLVTLFGCKNEDKKNKSTLTEVKVSEVAHSVFYAPQYLADSLGYFDDEGIDVSFILANGADAVMASVLSGDADIGFCGTEATIYVFDRKRKKMLSSLFQYKY